VVLKASNISSVAARLLTGLFIAGCIGLSFNEQRAAEATPPFAKKTGKACSFCHVSPAGGGKRTEAGEFYHKFKTLDGFKPGDTTVAAKPTPKPTPKPKPKATPKPKPKATPKAKKTSVKPTPKPPAKKS
jgi:outer membrane biosynthesis protein TonB